MKTTIYLIICVLLFSNINAQVISSERNPKYNPRLSPKSNNNINPKLNRHIDPKFNTDINPLFSGKLNPKLSPTINPQMTLELNPKYNTNINPNIVTTLNPYIGSWSGFYLFDASDNLIGILLKANDNVYLVFNNKTKDWVGYFIKVETNFNLFNLEGEWTGKYLSSDSESGYNLFDEKGEWTQEHAK